LLERRRRKFPPGNAQATGRQTLDAVSCDTFKKRALESGAPSSSGSPTEGERRRRLASDLSGHRTDGRHVHQQCCLLFWRTYVGRRTPLFELHQELGARIVDFGGWDMPVQ
jgi:hypothetical protein